MPTPQEKSSEPDPLANLQKLVEAIAAIIYVFFTNVTVVFGIGFLIILLILVLFFKLFGF